MGSSGILKKLDDLCKLPKTTDTSLIENFNKEFSKNKNYIASKSNDLNFTINHYVGKVTYSGENFLEKNRDSLPHRVSELLRNSSNEILSEIFSISNDFLIFKLIIIDYLFYLIKIILQKKIFIALIIQYKLNYLLRNLFEIYFKMIPLNYRTH
jgi:hypothetical protein